MPGDNIHPRGTHPGAGRASCPIGGGPGACCGGVSGGSVPGGRSRGWWQHEEHQSRGAMGLRKGVSGEKGRSHSRRQQWRR